LGINGFIEWFESGSPKRFRPTLAAQREAITTRAAKRF
jgi:hypothetical protein